MKRASTSLLLASSLFAFASLQAAQDPVLRVELGGNTSLELLLVPAGTAQLGSPASETGRSEDETQRTVTFPDAFYLGKTEVTVRQFEQFVLETRYRTEAERGPSGGFGWNGQALVQSPNYSWKKPGYPQTPDHPVSVVTWYDAREFCAWLTRKTGRKCGLPSEAQWEYACRAGTSSGWYQTDPGAAGWNRANAENQAHPVAQKAANAWGFFDMHGNVWEWCEDYYAPYDLNQRLNPLASNAPANDKPRRVLRGGSWLKDPAGTRSAARYRNDPRSRNADNGFRVMAQAALPKSSASAIPLQSAPTSPSPTGTVTLSSSSGVSQRELPQTSAHNADASRFQEGYHASFDFSWLFWGVLGVALFIAVRIVKAFTSGLRGMGSRIQHTDQSRPGLDHRIEVQPADDGFWIKTAVAQGSRLSWTCEANNRSLQGIVEHLPGPQGQFIFTGNRPSRIVVQVLALPNDGTPWSSTGTDYDSFGRRYGVFESLTDNSPHWRPSRSSEGHRPSAY